MEVHMLARDLMHGDPYVVLPSDTIARAADLMRNVGVGLLPVVDGLSTMQPAGVITDRDIAVRCVAAGHVGGCLVADHMTWPPLHTVFQDNMLSTVVEQMEDNQLRRLVVVDDDGKVVGVIAQADVVRKLGSIMPEKVVALMERVSAAMPTFAD